MVYLVLQIKANQDFYMQCSQKNINDIQIGGGTRDEIQNKPGRKMIQWQKLKLCCDLLISYFQKENQKLNRTA